MNGDWQAANNDCLAAALHWLRLVLRRHAQGGSHTQDGSHAQNGSQASWPALVNVGRRASRNLALPAGPGRDPAVTDGQVTAAGQAWATAAADEQAPALVELSDRLGLSPFEQKILLLCAAMELDPAAGPVRARSARRAQAMADLRPGPRTLRRPELGGVVAARAVAGLAPGRDHPAARPAADRECPARRRADRQLHQGTELPRRPARAPADGHPGAAGRPAGLPAGHRHRRARGLGQIGGAEPGARGPAARPGRRRQAVRRRRRRGTARMPGLPAGRGPASDAGHRSGDRGPAVVTGEPAATARAVP